MIELSRLIENCPGALLDVSLKALALGLCASLVLVVGRVKSPALRHAVWRNVLCGMLVLPLLSLLLPAILLPVLPGAPGKARGAADQSWWENPSWASASAVVGENAVSRVAPYEWDPGAQPNAPPNPLKGLIPAAALRVAWPAVIAGVYIVGVVGLFGRLLFGLVGCRRLVRGGCALDMVHVLSGCSDELGAALRRHRLPVLVCSAVRTPLTLGGLRSRILLPGDWSDWSDSKREAALAHELAHVERRDALFAALAARNQCLYWFHPLAWLLPRRLAWLSEQACDDRAIALTGAPIPYARHLLEFAGAMVGQRRRVTLGVLSMSDGGNLRARIDAVLDRSRALSAPLRRDTRLLLLVLALLIVPAIAALRVGPRALGSAGRPTQSDLQARPANGKTTSPPEPTYIEVRSVKPSDEAQATGGGPARILDYGLKYTDFDRMVETIPTIKTVLPIREIRKQVRRLNSVLDGRVVGTTADYADFNMLKIERGRFLTAADNEQYQNYAVLASTTARTLFPNEDPINQSIKLGSDYYTVVGVTKQRESSAGIGGSLAAQDFNKDVYIPLNTCKLRFGERIVDNRSGSREAVEMQLSRLILEVCDGADVQATAALVKRALEPHHSKGDVEVVILKPDRKTK
jgi:beta-lactamase regulating signal transducer with metallopeptidase domain